jgi:hypothetical protein
VLETLQPAILRPRTMTRAGDFMKDLRIAKCPLSTAGRTGPVPEDRSFEALIVSLLEQYVV